MADFRNWALQYVLAEEERSREDATAKTAAAIKNASSKSTAILHWVQSINPWIPNDSSRMAVQTGSDEDGESEVNVLARARALDFLADTLSLLDQSVLRTEQVNLLVVFFGRLFSVDHKAGISAAAKALQQLVTMKGFRPEMADTITQSVASMGDDFRLQTPQTRLVIYILLQTLLANESVPSQLQHTYGSSGGFALDLLRLCSHERDPKCLVHWFEILQDLTRSFDFTADVDEEIFKSFSAYFPISMRSTVTPTGITVDDLKHALRTCFAGSERLAKLALPFLIQKLDQADAITISVKVDILRTLKYCIEKYRHASQSIAPFTKQIWNSLKYEVRNGDVQETIDATLEVIRTLSLRLAAAPLDPSRGTAGDSDPSRSLVSIVLDDCLEDLANPTYTKAAGLLMKCVLEVHARPFTMMLPSILEATTKHLREPRTVEHAINCLGIMRSLLDARLHLIQSANGATSPNLLDDIYKLDALICEPFHMPLTRVWRENNVENPDTDQFAILKEVAQAFGALLCQPGRPDAGSPRLLYDEQQCQQVCATISDRIVNIFHLSSSPDTGPRKELADVVVQSLQTATQVYTRGFPLILQRAIMTVKDRDWGDSPSHNSLVMLKTLLFRLSYIGCSHIPLSGHPLQHLHGFTSSILQLLFSFLERRVSFEVCAITLSSIYSSFLNFRDACLSKGLLSRHSFISVQWKRFTANFIGRHTEFSSIGGIASNDLASVDARSDEAAHVPASNDTVREYIECALYITISLYQRATTAGRDSNTDLRLSSDFDLRSHHDEAVSSTGHAVGSRGIVATLVDMQDVYLHQLADLATFVLRGLEEEEQKSLQLSREIFSLFNPNGELDGWLCGHEGGRVNVLSLGVLQGLRPGSLAEMYASKTLAGNIVADVSAADSFPERTQKVRDRFMAVLANKWAMNSTTADCRQREVWRETIRSLAHLIDESRIGGSSAWPGPHIARYARIVAFAAGATVRRDKDIGGIVATISSLPASLGDNGKCMARCLEDLVVPFGSILSKENHGVAKPLYQQWVYVHTVRPKLEFSFPFKQNSTDGIVNAISVVHQLKYLPFSIYEEDTSRVVRLLIAAMSSFDNRGDVQAALQALRQVLDKRPDALKDQLKAVVAGAVKVLGRSHEPSAGMPEASNIPARFAGEANPALCRRYTLILLRELAQTFDGNALRNYAAQLSRVLANSCGDPAREVRQSALAARRIWAKVV